MNKSAVSHSDAAAAAKKRAATARLAGKRTQSASPLRPIQTADITKKGKRRWSSYSPPDFSKGAQGNVPAIAKNLNTTESSQLSLSDSNSPDFSLANEGGSGVKNAKDRPQTAKTKMQKGLSVKKREYLKLRKALLPQQNAMIELYACIRDLEQRMGFPAENIGDLRVISVTSWPPHDLLMLVQEDLHFPTKDISGIIGPQVLQHLFAQLSPVPDEVLQMGAQLIAKRIELINLLRKFRTERAYTNTQDFKARNLEQDQETERLNRFVAGTADNIKAKINYCLELAKVPWLDRDRYLKKVDRLKADNQVLQRKLEEAEENHVSSDCASKPKDAHLQEELAKERAAREASKEVVAAAESMLRVARARISSLERQLKESKAEVDAAQRKHKELEQLYRHRETSYDVRSKKLIEVSKTGEITIDALSRQRDALELRVKELHEQLDMADKMKQSTEAEQRLKIDSLQSKLAEQEKRKSDAEAAAADLKVKVKEMEEVIHNLRERSGALVDLERRRCLEYLPKKESEPSERETQLWRELQIVRLNLSRAEEELRQSRADKEDFLASLSKIAQEGAENVQEKMATVLLEKELKITKLQQVIDEQRENEKSMEQSMTEYEDQLASLRLHVKRLLNYDCYSKDEHSYPELETELLEMSMRVEELTRERSDLETAAASRALMLERHERAADMFARVTRARRELAAALEGCQEPPPIKDIPLAEASRSLSSVCVSAMETWTALRAERNRVLHLESAVLAQSLQLEREGRVRMHLEQRRALLERELLRSHSSTAYESASNYTKPSRHEGLKMEQGG